MAMNFPLSTAFTESHRFWVVVFFIFICFYAYFNFLFYFFCNLLIIQKRVVYPSHACIFNSFFSCSWHLILLPCDQKRCLRWFLFFFFLIYQDQIYGPGCDLSWRRFLVHLRKRWNSLFWGEMSYRYQLGLTGPLYHLKLVFPW